ncbi:MAG: hypothetical protein CMC70_07390 [Flavobacteriaceae bacterium]|nr:hypothetical protein [Flavobacteriaceae bacterium]
MKKILLFVAITMSVVACKENLDERKSNDPQYEGEFIYVDDGAVLKGDNFIYGVTIDEMSRHLNDKITPIKKDNYDMVPVIVKGTLGKKAEGVEGWDEVLTITEIVNVSETPSEADIRIEDKKRKKATN